jgi:FAD/FMN-containing dehydrogenase
VGYAVSRRNFLKSALIAGLLPYKSAYAGTSKPSIESAAGVMVNDVHSGLNPTRVSAIAKVNSLEAIKDAIKSAKSSGKGLSICGARHAAGGQEFYTDGLLVDITDFNRVLGFDRETGLLTVQSGIRWSALLDELDRMQKNISRVSELASRSGSGGGSGGDSGSDSGSPSGSYSRQKVAHPWGINQKQTGLNSLTIGGTLGANAHGQGLLLKPFVGDIESFTIINAEAQPLICSRTQNQELFSLAIGGYGLFGLVTDVTLRLVPRQKLKRKVHHIDASDIMENFDKSVKQGSRYGHCQLNVNEKSPDFLTTGVFVAYEEVPLDTPITAIDTSEQNWKYIVELVHTDKEAAFDLYAKSVTDSDNRVDWADSWQNNFYQGGYHEALDSKLHREVAGSEVLSEFYVPLVELPNFLQRAKDYFLANNQNVIFSSIRFIEKDDETFIPWARERYACIVLNFHTSHSSASIQSTMKAWSHLIDFAISLQGSFYLTYQHVAHKQQLLSCYPNFEKFLQMKLKHDPHEIFQSDWYQFHKKMFS